MCSGSDDNDMVQVQSGNDSHEHVPPSWQTSCTPAGAATGIRHCREDVPVVRHGTAHCAASVSCVQVRWAGGRLNHTSRAARAAVRAEPVRARHEAIEAGVSGGTATVSPGRMGD